MEHKILNSTFFPQEIQAIYLNDCVILGRFLSNRVAFYLVIQEFLLSQLYSNLNLLPYIYLLFHAD